MALIVLSARRVPLREKARWYLDKGVGVVWLLFPKEREVVVVTRADESRRRMGERLPAEPPAAGPGAARGRTIRVAYGTLPTGPSRRSDRGASDDGDAGDMGPTPLIAATSRAANRAGRSS